MLRTARTVRRLVFAAALLLLGTSRLPAAPPALVVASGGKSAYVIAIADRADPARLQPAAQLLQEIVREAAGVTLPILRESERPAGAPALCLGKTEAARAAGLPLDALEGWDYRLKTAGTDVLIAGADGVHPLRNEKAGVEHLGTLKGVTAFAETQWGVRFLLPGAFGRRIPRRDPLTVAADLEARGTQRFDYVIGRSPRSDRVFGVALNLFRSTPVLKSYGGHSYYTAVPRERYAQSNPEFFALRGGKRDASGNHLCISNPQVQERMLEEMETQLDKGYAWVELAQTDGYQACQCAACQALHPVEGERLWIVHRRLAEEMLRRRPGGRIMIISYGPTALPPRTFERFPENVVVQLCSYSPRMMAAWAPFQVDKTVYIYNWGSYKLPGLAPTRTPRFAIEQVRRFLDQRVRGIYLCGGYDPGVGYGLGGPALYAFGKALADPELDPDAVQDDYVNALFGEAAAPMRAFYRTLHRRLDTYCLFDTPNAPTDDIPSSFQTQEDYFCHVFAARTLLDLDQNLQRAAALAQDEKVRAALQMVEQELAFVRSVATVFHVYRAYRVQPDQAAFDALAGAMAGHRRLLDGIYDAAGKCLHTLPGGLPPLFAGVSRATAAMNGRTMGLHPPFNWDFAALQKAGILPGTAKPRRLAVRPIAEVTLDGRLDESAWQERPPETLGEMGLGQARNATRFRAACDAEAFYLAVECDFDDADALARLKATGRDGNAWQQECLEIAIDPFGEREKHCQLVFSPAPDATFDAQRGYIEDPLHPLFGKADVSWNGAWESAYRIDRERGCWTAEVRIPYAALEAPPPSNGTLWTFNLGRAEWPIPYGGDGYSQAARYSTWAPNLESRSFHDRASFGELVFEVP